VWFSELDGKKRVFAELIPLFAGLSWLIGWEIFWRCKAPRDAHTGDGGNIVWGFGFAEQA
jgi:hypothetical protein